MIGVNSENPHRRPQKAAPATAGPGAGGEGQPDPRPRRGRVEAGKARAKYPYWYDEVANVWRPTSEHPVYDPCRKMFSADWELANTLALLFDDRSGLDWLASAIPLAWTGEGGIYHFVRFVDTYLPRRNPDLLHGLAWVEQAGVPALFWRYKEPTRKRRYADPETLALHSGRDPWDSGELPACCYPSDPRPHVWSKAGFILPEGRSPFDYVRRLPWWVR